MKNRKWKEKGNLFARPFEGVRRILGTQIILYFDFDFFCYFSVSNPEAISEYEHECIGNIYLIILTMVTESYLNIRMYSFFWMSRQDKGRKVMKS